MHLDFSKQFTRASRILFRLIFYFNSSRILAEYGIIDKLMLINGKTVLT